MNQEESSLSDKAGDDGYFGLILELEEKNASRYVKQAEDLLRNRTLEIKIAGVRNPSVVLTARIGLMPASSNALFSPAVFVW